MVGSAADGMADMEDEGSRGVTAGVELSGET